MDREPFPTFANWKDRAVYLLASYKFLISAAIVVGIALLLWYKPQVDVPPGLLAAFGAWVLVGVFAGPGGFYIARWLRRYRAVTVFHINGVDDDVEKYYVPPAVWDEKTVARDRKPWPVNDGDAYAVREFDWFESTDTLVVEGCWLSDSAADDVLMTDKSHMEDIHDFLLDAYRVLGQVRGRWSRMAMQVEKRTINAVHEAQEKGRTLERDEIKQIWDESEADLNDSMPDDPPSMDDVTLDGYRPESDLDDLEIDRDQVTNDHDRRNR